MICYVIGWFWWGIVLAWGSSWSHMTWEMVDSTKPCTPYVAFQWGHNWIHQRSPNPSLVWNRGHWGANSVATINMPTESWKIKWTSVCLLTSVLVVYVLMLSLSFCQLWREETSETPSSNYRRWGGKKILDKPVKWKNALCQFQDVYWYETEFSTWYSRFWWVCHVRDWNTMQCTHWTSYKQEKPLLLVDYESIINSS